MNYEAAVRYLLSLGRELAAPTQAAAAKFDLENITILWQRIWAVRTALTQSCTSPAPTERVRRPLFSNRFFATPAFAPDSTLRRTWSASTSASASHGEEISDEDFAETFTRLAARDRRVAGRGQAARASHVL